MTPAFQQTSKAGIIDAMNSSADYLELSWLEIGSTRVATVNGDTVQYPNDGQVNNALVWNTPVQGP